MAGERESRREACVAKAAAEASSLEGRGVLLAGQALSSVLLLKGEPAPSDLSDGPLAGADGAALRAALSTLGYAPEDWVAMLSCDGAGTPLEPSLLREAICALDPATVVACDEAAAEALRQAYPDELAAVDDFDEAMLRPGRVAHVLGMRVLALGGFADALSDDGAKREMWHRLKQIPPLGEPY